MELCESLEYVDRLFSSNIINSTVKKSKKNINECIQQSKQFIQYYL